MGSRQIMSSSDSEIGICHPYIYKKHVIGLKTVDDVIEYVDKNVSVCVSDATTCMQLAICISRGYRHPPGTDRSWTCKTQNIIRSIPSGEIKTNVWMDLADLLSKSGHVIPRRECKIVIPDGSVPTVEISLRLTHGAKSQIVLSGAFLSEVDAGVFERGMYVSHAVGQEHTEGKVMSRDEFKTYVDTVLKSGDIFVTNDTMAWTSIDYDPSPEDLQKIWYALRSTKDPQEVL